MQEPSVQEAPAQQPLTREPATKEPLIPPFLRPQLQGKYDDSDIRRIFDGYEAQRVTTLRANTLLATRDEVARVLNQASIGFSTVPWYQDAFVLGERNERAVWELDAYAQGKVYLQSLSSMLPPLALGVKPGLDVLDMCAAPGGKTTQMAALSGNKARITATEMNGVRAEKLEYNLAKQGAKNVMVMRTDARNLDDFFSFDQILLDAPCSGSGTLYAFDPKMSKRFTPKLVQKSCKSQRALLSKALKVLKPGGTLLYSTCSILEDENEDVVRGCLKAAGKHGKYRVVPIELPGASCIPLLPSTLENVMTVCPTVDYEGFFMAKIVRDA